jgi:FKBP-type peptidyl-prolyl cis-trans isomerase (trigger factor)
MKTQVNKLDGTKRELNIEVNGDIVKNKFEEAFKKIAQEAKVKGFRQGHTPRDILEKNFSSRAHQLVAEELVPDTYNEAIKQEGLDVVEMPSITEVKLERDSLSFKATVEINPDITLGVYKGLKVNYKKAQVSIDEIKLHLDSLKEARKISDLDDKFAKGLGYPDLAVFQQAVERQLLLQKEGQERQKAENDIIQGLLKGLDFKLPQSMVNRQLEELLRQAKLDLALKGFPKEKIEEQEKVFLEKLQPQAREQVKIYLVLAAVAKKENIPLDDHMPAKVMELLLREADWAQVT